MWEFNAQVGDSNKIIEHIMGRHGMSCENENGQKLIEFCWKHGLLIDDTVFPHRDCNEVTWNSPDKDKQVYSKYITYVRKSIGKLQIQFATYVF
jgi:hypothetical protein